MNQDLVKYIEAAPESQQEILRELRKLVLSISSNASEQIKWGRPVYSTDKDFCYFKTTKKHLTLGFFEFDKIITNQQLLEGSGKSMRHVKLKNIQEIDDFQIKEMIIEVLK